MRHIKELTLKELEDVFIGWSSQRFCAGQAFSWIYQKGVEDFSRMTNLAQGLRQRLKDNFSIYDLKLIKSLESADGTGKFLFALKGGGLIEAVSIPAQKRVTGCVSTQVGCKFSCRLCASAKIGFKRNLTAGEMLDEVSYLKRHSSGRLSHIVFMGTGEPLDNYDNLLKAIRIINAPYAFNIGARRITISTCGIIPGIRKLADEGLQIELSVSLHAADEKTRSYLLPINKKYPLRELIRACVDYTARTNRQVTFEYVLIKDINSGLQSALNLGRILKGHNFKVNLIPLNPVKDNPVKGCGFQPPAKSEALAFKGHLEKQRIPVTLRRERGGDIEAACGQLRLRYENK